MSLCLGLTLVGLKPASVIRLGREDKELLREYRSELSRKGVEFFAIKSLGGGTQVLAYRPDSIDALLADGDIVGFLQSYGYDCADRDTVLARLAERMRGEDFPHELGIFLGYPLDDVIGYIESGGENCLLCGCWKVYHDPSAKMRIFDRHRKCYDCICAKLKQGMGIARIFNLKIKQKEASL